MSTFTAPLNQHLPVDARTKSVAATTPTTVHRPRTFGQTMAIAIAWATVLFLVGVGVPYGLHTGSFISGLGLGAFCAFWGGPGFGTMAGFAAWTKRNHDATPGHHASATQD